MLVLQRGRQTWEQAGGFCRLLTLTRADEQTKGMPRMTDLKPNRFNSPSPPEAAGDLLGMSQVKMRLSGGKGND